jgi:hypothetical protein
MSRVDYVVERVHLEEATPEEEAQVRSNPELVAQLAGLTQANALHHATFPAEEQLAAIQRKVHVAEVKATWAKRKRVLGGLGALVPLAAAATFLFMNPSLLTGPEHNPMEDRAKGLHPKLLVHILGTDDDLSPGAVAHPGDVLQLSYISAGAAHGVVISIDGGGTVSLHYPGSVLESTALDAKGEVPLPHGYQLDDAPQFERFFLVVSDAPIDVNAVIHAAESISSTPTAQTSPLPLAEVDQVSFLIRKAAR